MATPAPRTDDPAEQSDGALFDLYYDAVLDGVVEEPETFFSRHPAAGAEIRDRVRAVFSLHGTPSGTRSDGLPAERLGEFRLLRRLREGGMGAVYEARQESLGRSVALKVVRPEIRSSPSARARFEQEAAALARLRHPNVVAVHAFGEDRGIGYIAMEYVPGRGLDDVLAEATASGTPLPAARVIRWCARIARALECVHAAGIVHRDVKPSNIRITPDDRPVLLDFGVARDEEADRLTLTGPLVGSPLYAAPEQIDGEGAVDERTDVYGLGATLYECLAGQPVVERGTVEQVLHRKMHTDPRALGRLRKGLARDLEVVVMKALERDPARRYASAAAFADDLKAILAFQPIRARPPGPVTRARAWARRRPSLAAGLATCLIGAAIVSAAVVVGERNERARLRSDAAGLVEGAARRVDELSRLREQTQRVEGEVQQYLQELSARPMTAEHVSRLDAAEVRAHRLRQDRQEEVHAILELLRQAERIDPEVTGTDRVRADLYLERHYGARTWADEESARFFKRKVEELDPDGPAGRALAESKRLRITTEPSGAEVTVFRYVSLREFPDRTSPRMIPVPVGREEIASPGRIGLRYPVEPGSPESGLVVAVDGLPVDLENHRELARRAREGGALTVLSGQGTVVVEGRTDVVYRPTAAAALHDAGARVGRSPVDDVRVQAGDYLIVARLAGHEEVRLFVAGPSHVERHAHLRLHPRGTTPDGFVRVVRTPHETPIDVWMMEREVTCAEYLAFLNDPGTLRRIDASATTILVPRDPDAPNGLWARDESGRYRLPAHWRPDWPVVGVSFHDARAYIAWLTTTRPPIDRTRYALPSQEEWLAAGGNSPGRQFVFGNVFRPRWANTCFSGDRPAIEPVMSYPVDESPCGIYDMTGSASEWSSDWWEERHGTRLVLGGSWAQALPDRFRVYGGFGLLPDATGGECGFRLVMRPVERTK